MKPACRAAFLLGLGSFCWSLLLVASTLAQVPTGDSHVPTAPLDAQLADLDPTFAPMRAVIERFVADEEILRRVDRIPLSAERRAARQQFLTDWRRGLERVKFDALSLDDRIDYLLLQKQLVHDLADLEFESARDAEIAPLLPMAPAIVTLLESRRAMATINGRAAAGQLTEIAAQVELARSKLQQPQTPAVSPQIAGRALRRLAELRRQFDDWHAFYASYDPQFTWWTKQPYATVKQSLEDFAEQFRKKWLGDDRNSIVGDPIGRDALLRELAFEMMPYSPDELIAIAEREFAWCEQELLRASRELNFGDDWPQALAHVKKQHVEPGEQPELIRKLALEAIQFLDQRDLVTIPTVCRNSWRIEMMSPERQRVNPYFTGGEVISVSFPTDDMSHEEKLMSLRSNNIHFCRATVHHELIPGHHLQIFMAERYRAHRQRFTTPFLVEGWALYWEMLLWDLNFHQSAEDRVGMLFWRMHRCARIILSLGFHLNQQQPPQMVDFLVARVGHERSAAEAEVRRWVAGDYGPLYQAAYMLGGLQLRALNRELVASGKLTAREFHDAVLRENSIPIELIRAKLTGAILAPDTSSTWRFEEPSPPASAGQ